MLARAAAISVGMIVVAAGLVAGESGAHPYPQSRLAGSSELTVPSHIRVGLATDLDEVVLSFSGTVHARGRRSTPLRAGAGMRIKVALPEDAMLGYFRVQAAALKDEQQAEELAVQLAALTGQDASSVFDAQSDLYKVRVGRYGTREQAERARDEIASMGSGSAWIVREAGNMKGAGFLLDQAGREAGLHGRELVVRADDGVISFGRQRFRGSLVLFLNDRGAINVINELELEEYLRGVVPRELGPAQYPELEAIKAQTVAARTYTLRNLNEFEEEGYDICATPRCQVYGGVAAEHPLSDRAIAETKGEVLFFAERPLDAMYTSTCGGHTEDVNLVFPLKDEPYLKGVPCLEGGVIPLAGASRAGTNLVQFLMASVLPPVDGGTEEVLGDRLRRLARLAGLPVARDRLQSTERREVQRFVSSMFDLALDTRLFIAPNELELWVENPPPEWSENDRRLAAYFVKTGLMTRDLQHQLSPLEVEELLFELALFVRVLEVEAGNRALLRALAARPARRSR